MQLPRTGGSVNHIHFASVFLLFLECLLLGSGNEKQLLLNETVPLGTAAVFGFSDQPIKSCDF
jgi:hypothetical protein